MVRKNLILADEDEQYLRELRCEFMEKAPQLNLNTFTNKEKLYQFLNENGKADILVVDEKMVDPTLTNLSNSMTRIVLSFSMEPIENFEIIKKYQRMDSLLDAVMLRYAQESGTLEAIRGNSSTRMVAFYSPAGGTGKTTLALALASGATKSGLNTLYLNLEEIDSVKQSFMPTTGCLSDLFLALKTKGMQVGIKLKECVGIEPNAGFSYISGVESISEYEEISGDEIKKLMEAVREMSIYDLVILDLASSFTEKTRMAMGESDMIFVPVNNTENSIQKLMRLLSEANLHGKYDSLFDKMILVANRVGQEGIHIPSEIANKIPCCTSIMTSSVFSRWSDIFKTGDALIPIITPLVQCVKNEGSSI